LLKERDWQNTTDGLKKQDNNNKLPTQLLPATHIQPHYLHKDGRIIKQQHFRLLNFWDWRLNCLRFGSVLATPSDFSLSLAQRKTISTTRRGGGGKESTPAQQPAPKRNSRLQSMGLILKIANLNYRGTMVLQVNSFTMLTWYAAHLGLI